MGRSHSPRAASSPKTVSTPTSTTATPRWGSSARGRWWPIILAAGCSIIFLALAVGMWLIFFGAALTAVALVGWVYENYRGNFAH